MSNQVQTNSQSDNQQKEYFDLHTRGVGYLSRIRTVKPKGNGRKAEEMLCCAINAVHGHKDDLSYTYMDLRVTTPEAEALVLRCQEAVDAGKKVFVSFTVGDIYIHQYEKKVDGGKTEPRAILKGRLIGIGYVSVDGEKKYSAADNNASQGGDASQGTGTEG